MSDESNPSCKKKKDVTDLFCNLKISAALTTVSMAHRVPILTSLR
jgi:hypothetical protein